MATFPRTYVIILYDILIMILFKFSSVDHGLLFSLTDKPSVSFVSPTNKKEIDAPDTLVLNFSIDSFPSSNVTIFQRTKTLGTLLNVTGHHSFATSLTSCPDEGEYRVEAINDVGSDSNSVFVIVKCELIFKKKQKQNYRKVSFL